MRVVVAQFSSFRPSRSSEPASQPPCLFLIAGALTGLHKASFIVWFRAMTIHVLAYGIRAGRDSVAELAGRHLRAGR